MEKIVIFTSKELEKTLAKKEEEFSQNPAPFKEKLHLFQEIVALKEQIDETELRNMTSKKQSRIKHAGERMRRKFESSGFGIVIKRK